MPLTAVQRHNLINSPQFLGRVEALLMEIVLYKMNIGATGRMGQFCLEMTQDSAARAGAVTWLKWFALGNSAAGGGLTGEGATLDSDQTDGDLKSAIEAPIDARYV
jgi:hypothetical protein